MPDSDDPDGTLRRLRHDIAGAYNELRLCTEVLRVEKDRQQALEWLDLIERAADRCASVAAELESL